MASNGATPVYSLTTSGTNAGTVFFSTTTGNTYPINITGSFSTPTYVGFGAPPPSTGGPITPSPLDAVYQSGPMVMDDEEQKATWEAIKEMADRARQEQLEAEAELYERLEGLRVRLIDSEGWD